MSLFVQIAISKLCPPNLGGAAPNPKSGSFRPGSFRPILGVGRFGLGSS